MAIFDVISWWKAICLPILLPVSFFLISVTKLWDMIICLCISKGRTHNVKVTESTSGDTTTNTFDFYLHVPVKWQSKSYVSAGMYWQNLSEWCLTCDVKSSQCWWRICLNDHCDAAVIHVSYCITLRTDLMHMVVIFEIAYGMSWKSRRRTWMRKGEEDELYLPKTSEIIYLP